MKRFNRIPEVFCHEVEMHDLFCGKFTLSISRLMKMVTDARGLFFLALCCVLLFATDPNGVRMYLGPGIALVVWIMAVALYVTTLLVVMGLFSCAQDQFGPYPIYTPITSSMALFFVYITIRAILKPITDASFDDNFWPLFFNLMGAGLIIETLFVRFVMPAILSHAPAATTPPFLLKIGDRQLPVSKITYMTSQEHYIQVKVHSETVMIRARLSDAVAQTTENQGLQPHRSWWVSATAKPKIVKHDGKSVLKTEDGTMVPIAKARQHDVQNWLDLHGEW